MSFFLYNIKIQRKTESASDLLQWVKSSYIYLHNLEMCAARSWATIYSQMHHLTNFPLILTHIFSSYWAVTEIVKFIVLIMNYLFFIIFWALMYPFFISLCFCLVFPIKDSIFSSWSPPLLANPVIFFISNSTT